MAKQNICGEPISLDPRSGEDFCRRPYPCGEHSEEPEEPEEHPLAIPTAEPGYLTKSESHSLARVRLRHETVAQIKWLEDAIGDPDIDTDGVKILDEKRAFLQWLIKEDENAAS